ncbi:MAG: hypothetical protein KUG81_06860 [Gammaproteobacteria bacterium]|nr:hypothetical protein [Gammaproteobacteria bacterium]
MDVLVTTLSSSVIVGVFVFVFQQSFKTKLDQLSKRMDESIAYRSKDFDQSFSAINEVWKSVTLLEEYIKFDFAEDIQNGKVSNKPLRPLWLAIKQNMALLPDQIYSPTQEFLDKFGKSWESHCSETIRLWNLSVGRPEDEKGKIQEELNQLFKSFRENLSSEMNALRGIYRGYISEHFEKS